MLSSLGKVEVMVNSDALNKNEIYLKWKAEINMKFIKWHSRVSF